MPDRAAAAVLTVVAWLFARALRIPDVDETVELDRLDAIRKAIL